MKKKNIAISFLLLLVAAGIWYYVSLPAFNIHSSGVWYFVLVLVLAVGLVLAGKKGLRYGAIDLKEMKESKGFKWCVRLFILLLVIYLAGTILSSPIVNAKKYQQLLKVEEGEFTKDIEELSFDQIPLLDKESAQLLGDRKMGSMSDMVSQFEVDDIYSQINYKDRPVRVSPLKYANLIKWFTNRREGIPAYIRINMATQTTELVKLKEGIKYTTSEHLNRNIYRHLRFAHPTYIYGELSFEIDESGVPYWIAPVKKYNIGLFGGEGMTEPMRDEMHKVWGENFLCTQNYGMSELCGPGVAGECEQLCGMHINEDWFIPEIIDPKTEEVLPPGEKGELVVTCLGKEALPLVRYRTGDLTRLFYEPCKCGRTTVRMENLSGRADDMLVIRGVNVFPTQIEEVMLQIPEIGPHYEIVVERKNRLDVMTITVELVDDRLLDSYSKLSELEQRIKKGLKAQLGLATQIKLVAPHSLKRFEGKAKRVTDLRKDGL